MTKAFLSPRQTNFFPLAKAPLPTSGAALDIIGPGQRNGGTFDALLARREEAVQDPLGKIRILRRAMALANRTESVGGAMVDIALGPDAARGRRWRAARDFAGDEKP